jgi:hypothetical protein
VRCRAPPGSSDEDDDDSGLTHESESDVQDRFHPQSARSGRKSQTFLLHPQHAQASSKAQRLQCDPSKYFIPVPIGPALPRRDRTESLPKYCRLMLILFKPWRTAEDLRTPDQTWADAFSEFVKMCDDSTKSILNNMQVLHECRDAKDVEDQRRRDACRDNIPSKWSRQYEQFAGDVFEDDLLNHIGSVVNYASDRRSKVDADVIECLNELGHSGIFSVSGDHRGQAEDCVNHEDGLFLPEDLSLENVWRAAYDGRQKMWRQKLRAAPETSVVPEQVQNNPAVSNLAAAHINVPSVTSLESQPPPPPTNIDEIIVKWTLNIEQARAFSLIATHAQQNQSLEPMRMYLGGSGGTGKSRVITALTDYFAQRGESRRLRLASFTGIAAKNINGTTLHMALALNQHQNRKKGNGKTKADLVAMWTGVDYLFVDEVSMIGCSLLLQIHEALVDAKGRTEPFGGVNVIFAGDFAQLPPVSQTKLFSQAKSAKETTVFGQLLWRSIETVVMLTEQMRQVGTGNERFVEMLSRLRDGRCTQADYDLLNTRLLSNVLDDGSQTQWQCVPIVVYTNAIKDAINLQATKTFAKRTGREIYWYHAVDTYRGNPIEDEAINNVLDTMPSNKTGGRLRVLPLVLGMPIVVTQNFDVAGGIVNGSTGFLRRVRYRVDGANRRYLTSCIVELPDATADALPNLPPNHFAVLPDNAEMKSLRHPNSGLSCTLRRYQVPVDAGFAITAHKAQGQTLEAVIVDLASCIGMEAAYVMVSRCTSLDGLRILRPFPIGKINAHRSQEARDEFRRLDGLNTQTLAEFGDHGTGHVTASAVHGASHTEGVSQITTLFSGVDPPDVGSASRLLNQIRDARGGSGMLLLVHLESSICIDL